MLKKGIKLHGLKMLRKRRGKKPASASGASGAVRQKREAPKQSARPAESDPNFGLIPLSRVQQKAIRWRWPKRIPRDMVTVIAGLPKTGKSLVVSKIAATITRGGEFPAGEGSAKRGHVIMINGEDDPQQMLRPRIVAAGGDPKRVHILPKPPDLTVETLINKLEPEIKKLQFLRALILDPITSVISFNRNNADDVRAVLSALGALAAKHNIAVIVVVHLNKSSA